MEQQKDAGAVRRMMVAVAAVLWVANKSHILTVRHPNDSRNTWRVPHGIQTRDDERAVFAARRVLYEQTHVIADIQELQVLGYFDTPEQGPTTVATVLYVVEIDMASANLAHGPTESDEIRFVYTKKLTEGMTGPDHAELIRVVKQRYRT